MQKEDAGNGRTTRSPAPPTAERDKYRGKESFSFPTISSLYIKEKTDRLGPCAGCVVLPRGAGANRQLFFRRTAIVNLAKLLAETARKHAGKPAVVFEGTAYTFLAFDREVERYAATLHASGVGKGDRVAIQLPKRMEVLFLHFAILSLGAITLPLNPSFRAGEVEYFLSDSGSSLFVTDEQRFASAESEVRGLREVRTLLVDGAQREGADSLTERLARTPKGFSRAYPAGDDDVALLCYTSGTTGRSKGAMITHRNLISNMLALEAAWEWTAADVLLHALPLFHVHGLNVAAQGSLYAGSTLIMHEKFEAGRAWKALEEERCTLFMGVPTMYQRLMNEWEKRERKPDLRAMRVFISGSAPLTENLFHQFESATGFRILERYGMTETGMIASNPIDPAERKAKSVGYPLGGVTVRVVGEDGSDVPPGDVGEVWIRGDNVFRGYRGMPGKTQESFVKGWFRTGDLGYQDPEDRGRLYLVGRAKELIITGGYNVYPKEVETILESHEAVRESAAIGLPDEEFGEKVVAVVVLKEGKGSLLPEALVEHCKRRLAPYKCPRQIAIVAELPRNAMGKIQKNRIPTIFLGEKLDESNSRGV
jgi:malonyl-CoA/methylmalonyl-CoA synthetase